MSCLSVLAGNQLVMWDVTYKSLFKTTMNPTSHSHFTWINKDFWTLSQLSKRYKNYLLTVKPTTNREIKFDTGRWDFYELNFKSCLDSWLALHERFVVLSYRVSFGLSLHRDRHPLIMLWLCELWGPPLCIWIAVLILFQGLHSQAGYGRWHPALFCQQSIIHPLL